MSKFFLNGEIVESSKAKVSAGDGGFLYGIGLFETMRAVGGKVFAIDDHLNRLFKSAEVLSVNNSYSKGRIAEAVEEVLAANGLSEARLRLTLTGGTMGEGDEGESTLLITATELSGYPEDYYAKGVRVVLTDYRQNPVDPLAGHKVTSYASRLLVLREAHKRIAAEALWFTAENKLAEGCISNVFLVKDSVVYTPRVETPVLPGVARKHVLGFAKAEGIEAIEKDLTIQELLAADEVFLTNVIMLVLPVVAVEAHSVGGGEVGELSKRLLDCFNKFFSNYKES
jgi:branched-subunit amino acid aminotransferase/4-amino-4-deoxychorismate lyase